MEHLHDDAAFLQVASAITGLHDYGDERFLVPLRAYLRASHEVSMQMTDSGRAGIYQEVLRLLSNRLKIEQTIKDHPDILQVPLRRPMFILGLPRTGTTLLHGLLAQDSAARAPLLWELMTPTPPPEQSTRNSDERLLMAKFTLAMHPYINKIRRIHAIDATDPEEFRYLLRHSFASPCLGMLEVGLPDYVAELQQLDMVFAYAHLRRQLQILLWHCPAERLVLKSPFQMDTIDALLEVFPDACVIQIHRSPAASIASACSLFSLSQSPSYRGVDPNKMGAFIADTSFHWLTRGMRSREKAGSARFFDVDYKTLVRDSVSVAKHIYGHFGFDMSPAVEEKMTAWLKTNPQNKHGQHRYTLEQFGLTDAQIRQRFAEYYSKFSLS